MKEKIFKVIKVIFISILSIILALNLIIVFKSLTKPDEVPSLLGYKPFIVMSGSMESNISVGDLVIVKDVDTNTLEINDIIAFREDKIVTTHRIIDKVESNGEICYKTKGDANNIEDDEIVCPNKIEGKYKTKIPKVGTTILFIQEPLGFTIMMLTIVIICMIFYIINNRSNDDEFEFESEEEKKEFEEFKRMKNNKKD